MEKLHLHSEARSKHDIQNNHIINMMVATAPVANAMGNGFISPGQRPGHSVECFLLGVLCALGIPSDGFLLGVLCVNGHSAEWFG